MAINLTAAPDVSAGADYGRVTLAAHRLDEGGNEIGAPDVSVSYSAGAAVSAREISRSGGVVVLGFRPASGNDASADVVAHPQVGRTITISLNLVRSAREVAADDVVAAAGRSVALSAAVGFFGPAYAVPVEEGYTLRNAAFTPDGAGAFDSESTVIALAEGSAVGGSALDLAMAADVVCPAGVLCQARQITVTVTFEPVGDPGQVGESAVYLDGFVYDLILPSGYENGGALAAGRTLILSGVNGVAADALGNVSLSVNSKGARMTYAPNGEAADALTVGGYTATIAMTQAELLGTVFMRVGVEVSARPLSAGDYGLSEAAAEVATVAAGAGAVGLAVATVSLTTSATNAEVVLPGAFPAGLSISRTADTRGAVFYLSSALAGGAEVDEDVALTVSRTDNANYAPLERIARVRVSALQQAAAAEAAGRIVDGAPFASADVANLKTGDYAEATFARVDDESSAELLIDANSGAVSTDGDIAAGGRYSLVALATSADYIGAARLEVILNVLEQSTLGPADSVPEGARVRTRLAVAGYAGSVAFFAGAREGVTLETPGSAPVGFGFGEDGDGARFVSPEGFTLFVEAGQIEDEGDAVVGAFTLTARLAGFAEAEVPVTVTVTAVLRPAQLVLQAAYDEEFSHSPVLPLGLETGAGLSVAGVSVSGEGDGANLFAVVNGRVEQGAVAPDVGQYEVSVAVTHSDLLGTLTLVVSAEIAAAELAEGDYGLTGLTPEDEITVAAGYVGSVYAVALSDDATDGVIQLPADVTSDEFELALSDDSRTAELRLTSAATGRDVSGVFTLTVVRESGGAVDGNYEPLPQTLFATVSALPEPAAQEVSGDEPFDFNFDLRAALGGVYAQAEFEPDSTSYLQISYDGIVSPWNALVEGEYRIVVTATASAFLGTAQISFSALVGPPVLARFYENDFYAAGDTAILAAGAHPLSGYTSRALELEFFGRRRGLALAAFVDGGSSIATRDALLANDFAAVRQACSDGGTGWRLPNFSEAVGLLSESGTSGQVSDPFEARVPGVDSTTITVNFPAAAVGNTTAESVAEGGFGVLSDLPFVLGDINLAGLILNDEDIFVQTSQDLLRLFCVLPSDGYVAPVDPAGVLANGVAVEEGAATITLSAEGDLAAGENYGTITLAAWRFDDAGGTVAATDNGLSHSVGSGAVSDETTGSNGEIVLGLRPASGDSVTAEIVVNPAIGRTVTIYAALEREARDLDPDEYGLSAGPGNVFVVAGAVGVAVATVSLTTSATNAEVLLPSAFPAGISISQTADSRGVVFYLASALAGGAEIDESVALTVSRTDSANYSPLERIARVRVSALQQAAALEFSARSTDGKPHSAEKFANLRTGDYANATFTRADESSAGLTIDGATGDVSADNLVAGSYVLVALATSPDYVGRLG